MLAEGYNPIATSEGLPFGTNKAIVYRNNKEYRFILEVNGITYGPFLKVELELITHVLTDVLDMIK